MDERVRGRIGVGLICLSIGFAATVVAQQGDQPRRRRSVKIGVVDVGVLFKEYARKDDLEQSINEERERMKENVKAEAERLKKMRDALDAQGLRRDSIAWLEQADRIRVEQHRLEYTEKRLQLELKKRVEEFTLQILGELEQTIAAYGKRYGFSLVLKIDKASQGEDAAEGSLAEQFQERIFRAQISDVLFHKDEINITQGVLDMLNSPEWIEKMQKQAQDKK
jgi:Skp family chaperone for outer membrane proteins